MLRGDKAVDEFKEKGRTIPGQSVAVFCCDFEERVQFLLQLQLVCTAQKILGKHLPNSCCGEFLIEGLNCLHSSHAWRTFRCEFFCAVRSRTILRCKEYIIQLLLQIIREYGLHGREYIHILVEWKGSILCGS